MKIFSLILFGSAARGTAGSQSDIDLLAVTDGARPKKMVIGQLEVQFLNLEDMRKMAEEGSLFGLHLAHEARPIFDPDHFLADFSESIAVRPEYSKEKHHAASLAGYLLRVGEYSQKTELIAKRIAWCVRTYIIADAVESGKFIFSPEGLVRHFKRDYVSDLIGLRRGNLVGETSLRKLAMFLDEIGFDVDQRVLEDYLQDFAINNNRVALSTIRNLQNDQEFLDKEY